MTRCISYSCHAEYCAFFSQSQHNDNEGIEVSLCDTNDFNYQIQYGHKSQGIFGLFGGKIKLNDNNITNSCATSDLLIFGTETQLSTLSYSTLKNNTVSSHGLITMEHGSFSIFASNFLDLDGISSAVQLYKGMFAIISTTNFEKFATKETITISSSEAEAFIHLIKCYIEGEKFTNSMIKINVELNIKNEVAPALFQPFDVFLCSGKKINKFVGVSFFWVAAQIIQTA